MKNLSMSLVAVLCVIIISVCSLKVKAQSPPCNTNAPVTYTLAETSPGEIYIPDASTRPWKGGDTLKIPAKTYSLIEISNFSGDACKKIVIINSGGQVVATTWRMRMNSRYFKITGTGKAGVDYGFKINGGMMAISVAHHFEIDHVEATGGSLGFYIKAVPDLSNPLSVYTVGSSNNYVMTDIYLHHNYFHDIAGEGMYIGHTGPSGDQEGTGLVPIRLDNVDISYNTVINTDWDGIQLSNARNSKIHHNTVWNFGRINKGSQQAGIILGGNTTGEVYNNTISKGTGTGIQLFGYGTIKVYNNTIDSTGEDNTTIGQESFYANDNITSPEQNPKQQILFYNNVVRNPKPKGAVRVIWYNNNSLAASITNNQYYIPNAASNWQAFHVVANPPGSILTNNVLIGSTVPAPNQAPVANAGADRTITLPVNSVTLTGTGIDTDGSITGYAWTKLSGPVAVINSASSATTNITGLLQGTYSFELRVTDNAGATATDIMQVIVNPLVVPNPVPTPVPVLKPIKVNIHGGTTFNNAQWNNWNTSSALTSTKFKYDDGSLSDINAVLNSQAMMADNGSGYATAATSSPSDVLRFNSASTSTRVLTIIGLKPSSKYNFEFYGSRKSTGNKSVYTIGSVSDTIDTDNNLNDAAKFTSISPDNTGKVTVEISRIGSWNYIAGFMISEQGTAPTAPQLVANAGSDKEITLPVNTVTLTGSGSGATISSYKWTAVSGPAVTLANSNLASLLLTALLPGAYTFQLTVTSSTGATASDNVVVLVNASISTPSKSVNVNLNGGTGFSNSQWNNWNTSSLTSAKFLYDDATTSNINAVLNSQAMMVDNGTGYATASTNPPSSVLRFNSASTSTRTLTIKGLNPSKNYDFEFYGSRKSTGNKTLFTVGNVKDTLSTDNNVSDVAKLNNLSPDNNGNLEILIERIGTWNYLAGFTIHEEGSIAKTSTPDIMSSAMGTAGAILNAELTIHPNPFTNQVKVEVTDRKAGNYDITLTDATGTEIWKKTGTKEEKNITESIDTRGYKTGVYVIQVRTKSGTSVHTVTKKIEPTEL